MFKTYIDGPTLEPLSWEQSQITSPVINYPPPEPSSASAVAINPQPDPSGAENPLREPVSW